MRQELEQWLAGCLLLGMSLPLMLGLFSAVSRGVFGVTVCMGCTLGHQWTVRQT